MFLLLQRNLFNLIQIIPLRKGIYEYNGESYASALETFTEEQN